MGQFHETAPDPATARQWYEKAHAVWAGWTSFGHIMNPYVQRREHETAALLARTGGKA
jgi:hypothetical protein